MKLSEENEKYLFSLIEEGKAIEAVKFVKEKTGMALSEAKHYVDIRINGGDENYSIKNNNISENEEKHISSLIKENEKLKAIAFLHKEKEMSLKEAKEYIDSKVLTKRVPYKRGFVFNENLNEFVPDLTGQKKAIKILPFIILILIISCPIQLYFLDRTSSIKILILIFSILWTLTLLTIYFVFALNIRGVEKRMKEIEEIELSNEFEVKALRKNGTLFFYIIFLAVLVFVVFINISTLLKESTYKNAFSAFLLIGLLIFQCYELLKLLKGRRYSLNISNRTINILYNNIEVNSIKIDNIDLIKFYSISLGKGAKESKPTMQISDKSKKKLPEISISIRDYYILKKYFTKNNVKIYDSFNMLW